jgi:MerR family transcriptional regulator, light-induced transcriptional regulator
MDIKTKVLQTLRFDKDIIAHSIVGNDLSKEDFSSVLMQALSRDEKYNIEYLLSAVEIDSVANFNAYIIWLRDVLRAYNLEDKMLIDHLNRILDYVTLNYSKEYADVIEPYITEAIFSILNGKGEDYSYLDYGGKLSGLAYDYFNALIEMNKNKAVKLIMDVVGEGEVTIKDLYLDVFTNVLYEIGRYWAMRKITVGQEHFATAVTVYTMSLLYDKIFNNEEKEYKMIGVCVGDELHEIGIRMVCDIFELNKWDTYYLGANVPNESVLSELKKIKPDILAISVTLANKVPSCIELISLIRSEYPSVKIIVGGRPFNTDENLWKTVGADDYSLNANDAVNTATRLLGGNHE